MRGVLTDVARADRFELPIGTEERHGPAEKPLGRRHPPIGDLPRLLLSDQVIPNRQRERLYRGPASLVPAPTSKAKFGEPSDGERLGRVRVRGGELLA